MDKKTLSETFELHPRLTADTLVVTDLPQCRVLLMNDSRYPWLILVPRHNELRELHDLAPTELAAVMEEVRKVSEVLVQAFGAFKINVAALGNMVPQLHIHVIARSQSDPAWPGPVWGVGAPLAYSDEASSVLLLKLEAAIGNGKPST
ncbi:HIT domain-containing protein [Kiloniella laminariae]|uniref:HIT domain-containing protein n=1 Tax=Kiloniella laminariae TaxID=454162 RepID=A0ABT4LNX5_9PROT|nr:HIT domain-containing protein [Kiloniella laminariae]MCZ4282814.1 HIT domain-containing protein [Kiloniella laminariae]